MPGTALTLALGAFDYACASVGCEVVIERNADQVAVAIDGRRTACPGRATAPAVAPRPSPRRQ
jgi:hypothetical protein